MTALIVLLIIAAVIWIIGTAIIACNIDDGSSRGLPDERKYAWIFFWPVMVGIKAAHALKLGYKEAKRALSTEI